MTAVVSVYLCPVCRRPVSRFVDECDHGRIGGHLDRAHGDCPGSWEPWGITIADDRGRGTRWPPG